MEHIRQYINFLSERNLSANTIKVYSDNLIEFWKFLGRSKFSIRAVKREQVRSFLFSLSEKNNQPITRRLKQTTLRGFFEYLENENLIKENPTRNIPILKVQTKEPTYITDWEIRKILKEIKKEKNKYAKRNEIMVLLLAETGIRLSELTNLNVGDINTKEKTIRVIRKGNIEQTLPINSNLDGMLRDFIKNKKADEALLISSYKKRITNRRVGLLFQDYIKKAEIEKKVSVHSMRHGFCVRLLEKGVDIKTIQVLCNHKNIETTGRYLHIAKNRLRKEVGKIRIN